MRYSPEDAEAKYAELSDDEKAIYERLRAFCQPRWTEGQTYRRRDARDAARCGNDAVIKILPILEARERPGRAAEQPAEAQLPPEIDASARVRFNEIRQQYGEAFLKALRDQSERDRLAFRAEIDAGAVALRVMTERFTDAESLLVDVGAEMESVRAENSRLAEALDRYTREYESTAQQVKALTATRETLDAALARAQQENADVRHLNEFLTQDNTTTKEERDSYRTKAEELSETAKRLEIEIAVVRERHEGRLAEYHRAEQLLREEHANQLEHASQRISELERLLTAQRVHVGVD